MAVLSAATLSSRRRHKPVADERPLWRRSMLANTWAEIPTANMLSQLDPELNPAINPDYPGTPDWGGGQQNIINAWCGACYDTATDTLWLPLNGGHGDYAGNEPYRVMLRADAPTFEMVRPPSGAIGNEVPTHDYPMAQAGSTSTEIVLASGANAPLIWPGDVRDEASAVDGAYVGATLTMSSQTKNIVAYNGTTRTATVDSAITGTIVGTIYVIYQGGSAVHGYSGELTGRLLDGQPRAIHSYNKLCYVPGVGPFVTVQGSVSWSAQAGTDKTVFVDPVTGNGTVRATSCPRPGQGSGAGSCWDPTRSRIWFRGVGTTGFATYDPATDTWTSQGGTQAVSGYNGLAYMTGHDCLFWACDYFAAGFAIFDCAALTLHQPSLSGALVGATLSGRMQPHWVPSLGGIAVWDNSTDTTKINLLTPGANPRTDAWTVSQLAVSASNAVTPTAKTTNGTYGRFQYSSWLNGFLVLNAVTQKPYFFALD